MGCDSDCVRTGVRVCCADLIGICSSVLMDVLLEVSVIGGAAHHRTITNHIDLAAISRAPIENHKPVATLSAHFRAERDLSATATCVRTDAPVTRKSEVVDQADGVVLTRILEVRVAAGSVSCGPALAMQRAVFVEPRKELL